MSFTKSIIVCGSLPSLVLQPSHKSQTRILSLYSSSYNFAVVNDQDRSLSGRDNNNRRAKKSEQSRRRFVVCVVQPGAPPPSEPPFNFINWILGVAITVVLPFFSHKWASLLKLKNEVETAVETAEEIVEAVGKAAEGVERFAEDIADDLPEGGGLRKAVDFVENLAERASEDAHLVVDFIDKVQEAEEKVEEYVEEAISHEHHKEKEEEEEEDRAHEPPKEENNDVHGDKQ